MPNLIRAFEEERRPEVEIGGRVLAKCRQPLQTSMVMFLDVFSIAKNE